MLKVSYTARFKRAEKKLSQADVKLVKSITDRLAMGEKLPKKYRDHALSGEWKGFRECHVKPDLLLIYGIEEEKLLLVVVNVGKHSEVFKK